MVSGASRAGIEGRMLELSGGLMEVHAAAHWSDARVEAWVDWARGEPDLPHAVADYVETLTARAQAKGILKDVRARTRFRDGLTDVIQLEWLDDRGNQLHCIPTPGVHGRER